MNFDFQGSQILSVRVAISQKANEVWFEFPTKIVGNMVKVNAMIPKSLSNYFDHCPFPGELCFLFLLRQIWVTAPFPSLYWRHLRISDTYAVVCDDSQSDHCSDFGDVTAALYITPFSYRVFESFEDNAARE